MQKWKVLSSEYVYQNRPFDSTRKERCLLPNGIEIDYYVHEHPHWTNAIVVTPTMELVTVRQYRHGNGQFMIEIPGGIIEDGESPIDAIIREVAEETGYRSDSAPISLGEFYPNPATTNNTVTTYLFQNAMMTEEQHLDSTEELNVRLVPFDTFGEWIQEGKIQQLFSVAAYYLAKDYLTSHK